MDLTGISHNQRGKLSLLRTTGNLPYARLGSITARRKVWSRLRKTNFITPPIPISN